MEHSDSEYVPVTFDRCNHIEGPFYHGTKFALGVGDQLTAGHDSNFEAGRVSNHVDFSRLIEPAIWGAELATALSGTPERGRIYVVEPIGPFEDDPNLTNKRFAGNVTQSYRTPHPLRIVGEVETWEGHAPEALQAMLERIAAILESGQSYIED